jgi:alkanesulfonate monooxygenase SsuD/methylene tetrahydromethanopterin reductase-like flavin-dependent oxidoreductase (luciferase family)
MEFGMQFFPDVGPEQKSGERYFDEALKLVDLCDTYGYTHVRTVEHYFHPYGGYSPNPHVFLTAASQRSQKARLVVGAVLPVFNHPLKIAGEIGMLDAISNGRLECGFARAFLPHEYQRFGVSLDESVARFDEGVEQVRRLLEEENVTMEGRFHSFKNVTSLPRPTQKPRPQFWTAAFQTAQSFEKAGRTGHWIMAIPIAGGAMRELCDIYREAWHEAGHPGRGRVMLAFHMFCARTREEAYRIAREPLNRYLKSLVDAASDWTSGTSSADYKNYDKMIAALDRETFESQVEKGAAWVGTPDELIDQIERYDEEVGGIEDASLQVNFNTISYEDAERSTRLFGEKVIPYFQKRQAAAE